MTSRAALKEGFSLARRAGSAVWILFLANLGLAALAGLPIYRGILGFTGHSLESQRLTWVFSPDWLTDFDFNNPGSLNRYAAVITLFGLLSIPINSVLAGGVLARFRDPEQTYSPGCFFRNTARYAGRLIGLMIIGLTCYWIVFRVLNRGLGNLVDAQTRDWLDDRPVFLLHLGVYTLLFLGLAWVNVVIDYARVKLVMDEGSNFVEAFFASLGFCLGRLRRAATVCLVPSCFGVGLLALYRLLTPWSQINTYLADPRGTRWLEPLTLAALFILQQAIMLGRYWFRVATWASEWSYFRETHRH
jgi:hypothetical protein